MNMINRVFIVYIMYCMLVYIQTKDGSLSKRANLTEITSDNVQELVLVASFDQASITDLTWSNDGEKLLLGMIDGVGILDVSTYKIQQLEAVTGNVQGVAFLNDTHNAVLQFPSSILIYDIDASRTIKQINTRNIIKAISHDGSMYAMITLQDSDLGVEGESIIVQRIDAREILREIPVDLIEQPCTFACPVNVAFSEDASMLVFAAQVPEVESGIVDLQTGEKLSTNTIGTEGLTFNHDNSIIASLAATPGYIPETLILTDSVSAEIIAQVGLYATSSPNFDYTGHLLAVGAYDTNSPNPDEATGLLYIFRVINSLNNGEVQQLHKLTFITPISEVKFSPDNRLLAVYNGHTLQLWGVLSSTLDPTQKAK